MKHAEVRQKLSEYLDGQVSEREKALIEEHFASCPACSAALKDLQKTLGHVKSLEEVEPPPWMAAQIMAKIREEAAIRKRSIFSRLFLPLHIKLPVQAMAMVLVTVTAFLVYKAEKPQILVDEPVYREDYQAPAPAPGGPAPSPQGKGKGTASPGPGAQLSQPAERQPAPEMDGAPPPPASPETFSREAIPPAPSEDKGYLGKDYDNDLRSDSHAPAMKSTPRSAAPLRLEEREESRSKATGGFFEGEKKETYANVALTVKAGDVEVAAADIEREIARLGGNTTGKQSYQTGRTLTALIDARKLPELLSRLSRIGEVKGGESMTAENTAGKVNVTIELVPAAK